MPEQDEEVTKQKRHADLAAEHQRLKEWHEKHSGGLEGQTKGPNNGVGVGAEFGNFFGTLADHKWAIVGVVGGLIVIVMIARSFSNNYNQDTSNQSPNYTNGDFVPANIQAQLDNINNQISGLANKQGSGQGNTLPPTSPPTGGDGGTFKTGPVNTGGGSPQPIQPQPQYVTVSPWQNVNPPWNSYLSGIAQHEGISLSRIESLNPNITNPNLIYAGQQIRVS